MVVLEIKHSHREVQLEAQSQLVWLSQPWQSEFSNRMLKWRSLQTQHSSASFSCSCSYFTYMRLLWTWPIPSTVLTDYVHVAPSVITMRKYIPVANMRLLSVWLYWYYLCSWSIDHYSNSPLHFWIWRISLTKELIEFAS